MEPKQRPWLEEEESRRNKDCLNPEFDHLPRTIYTSMSGSGVTSSLNFLSFVLSIKEENILYYISNFIFEV
jgi:hypothetical protein